MELRINPKSYPSLDAVYPISQWQHVFAQFEAKQGRKILLMPLSD